MTNLFSLILDQYFVKYVLLFYHEYRVCLTMNPYVLHVCVSLRH